MLNVFLILCLVLSVWICVRFCSACVVFCIEKKFAVGQFPHNAWHLKCRESLKRSYFLCRLYRRESMYTGNNNERKYCARNVFIPTATVSQKRPWWELSDLTHDHLRTVRSDTWPFRQSKCSLAGCPFPQVVHDVPGCTCPRRNKRLCSTAGTDPFLKHRVVVNVVPPSPSPTTVVRWLPGRCDAELCAAAAEAGNEGRL